MPPRYIAVVVSTVLIAGCQVGLPVPSSLSPYRIDIQQGNLVTQDMVEKLQPGMTRSQVRFVLGTPLVTDIFHTDRWDYVYRFEKAGKLIEHRRIVAVFNGDKLVRIDGDVVPAAAKPKPAQVKQEKPAAAPVPVAAKPEPVESRPVVSATPATDAAAAGTAPAGGDNTGKTAVPRGHP